MAVNTQQTGSGGNGGVEARIARLESDVAHLCTDVADIKLDLRELRKDMYGEFKTIRDDFRILWGALMFLGIGLAGMMAKGFGWL